MEPRIQPGEIWTHIIKGTRYIIDCIANEGNGKDDDHNPPIVIYREVNENDEPIGKVWARRLDHWRNSFVHPNEKPIGRGG